MESYYLLFLLVLVIIFVINKMDSLKFGSVKDNTAGIQSKNIVTKLNENKSSPYGEFLVTLKGHLVRSKGEKAIADYLYRRQIYYHYEPKISGLRPDFYLKEHNTIIEYWGMVDAPGKDGIKYKESMTKKLSIYQIKQFNVISVFPKDISSNYYIDKINQVIPNGLKIS